MLSDGAVVGNCEDDGDKVGRMLGEAVTSLGVLDGTLLIVEMLLGEAEP